MKAPFYKHKAFCPAVDHEPEPGECTCGAAAFIQAWREGARAGLFAFAWWRDGEQYVGTCGTTLAEALRNVDRATPTSYI